MNVRLKFCTGCVVFYLFLGMAAEVQAATMNIVYFDNYPPFSWKDKEGQMQGILVDILNEALESRMGIDVVHSGYPWKRAQELVKQGLADAFCTIPTTERRSYTEVSGESVLESTFTLFAPVKSQQMDTIKRVTSLADLKGFLIGHFIGAGWAKSKLADMDIYWVARLDQVLRMLARERVDIHVGSSAVVRHAIKVLGLEQEIVEIPTVLDSQSFHLCIKQQSSNVKSIPQFDETIKHMKSDGTLAKIYDSYLN